MFPAVWTFCLPRPLSASFALWMDFGVTKMGVNPDSVIETMILDVEEENDVEYEWVEDED